MAVFIVQDQHARPARSSTFARNTGVVANLNTTAVIGAAAKPESRVVTRGTALELPCDHLDHTATKEIDALESGQSVGIGIAGNEAADGIRQVFDERRTLSRIIAQGRRDLDLDRLQAIHVRTPIASHCVAAIHGWCLGTAW